MTISDVFCTLIRSPEVIAGAIQATATVGAVGLAAWFALKQIKRQHDTDISADLRRRQADALQTVWGLLAYLSETENAQSILKWVEHKEDGKKVKTWYVRPRQLEDFVFHALPDHFYTQGAGLYLPTDIRNPLFTARSILYGLWLSIQADLKPSTPQDTPQNRPPNTAPDHPPIALKKIENAEKIIDLYKTLNQSLRTTISTVYLDQNLRIHAPKDD